MKILAIIAATLFVLVIIYGIYDAWKLGKSLKREAETMKKMYAKEEKERWLS